MTSHVDGGVLHAVREALCFLLLVVLITFGWNQPYRDHYRLLTGASAEEVPAPDPATPVPSIPPPAARVDAVPSAEKPPTSDRNWIYDKTRMDDPHSAKNAKGTRGGR